MAKTDWAIVGLGALVLVGGAFTPWPDDVATAPLGLGLIAYGTGLIK